MTTSEHLIRFDTYVKRHPSLTVEEFHHTWTTSHAQLLKTWLARHGVYRYTLFHTPPDVAKQYLGQEHAGGGHVMESFDGHAEILLESWDILGRLRADPYYVEVVEPSEVTLIDKASVVRRWSAWNKSGAEATSSPFRTVGIGIASCVFACPLQHIAQTKPAKRSTLPRCDVFVHVTVFAFLRSVL
ncbi:hypothetical protein CBS133816_4267 [Aspergillus niger]|nr:hypothetical protein CBS133816_4267 [Aspergillus niger]